MWCNPMGRVSEETLEREVWTEMNRDRNGNGHGTGSGDTSDALSVSGREVVASKDLPALHPPAS